VSDDWSLQICNRCGDVFLSCTTAGSRCKHCLYESPRPGVPGKRVRDSDSEGDHGYGSYYTHAMTAADQGYW
jgi:hypothetical protein